MKPGNMTIAVTTSTMTAVAMPVWAVNRFEDLSSTGTPVARVCQGIRQPSAESATTNSCRLVGGALPVVTNCATPPHGQTFGGLTDGSRWIRIRAVTGQALVANGTTAGTLEDRVWQRCDGTSTADDYIFGLQAHLNANHWTEPSDDNLGLPGSNDCDGETAPAFEVNDIYRCGFSAVTSVSIAYRMGSPGVEEGVRRAGRTDQGLAYLLANGGTPYDDPARNNDCVHVRTEVSAEHTESAALASSAFVLVRGMLGGAGAAGAVSATQVGGTIRLEEGGAEGQCKYRIEASGFRPL
jgi:hypothetical protein